MERSEDAKDRRRTLVRLTDRGAELIVGRHKQTETKLRQWLSQLSEVELTQVAHGLSILFNSARGKPFQTETLAGLETVQ